jgi:hypothetical protein
MAAGSGGHEPAERNMNRRQFLFAVSGAAAVLAAARTGHAECGEQTSVEFVEELYEKQARLHAANTPLGENEFDALFARELRQIMRAPRRYPKNEPIGPLLHAFFGWGVLPGTEVKIGKVALVSGRDGGPATVRVEVKYRGERHMVLVRVVQESELWRIAGISYDSGKSLADHYRGMTRR